MVKKIKKYAKFIVCLALIMGLIAPSYAALSASDGSAFVTKAEFDSALADFNARLTTFEAGINSKIDSQVTSYLDRNGIWNGKTVDFFNNVNIVAGPNTGTTGVEITSLNLGASAFNCNWDNRNTDTNNLIGKWIKQYQKRARQRIYFTNNDNKINGASFVDDLGGAWAMVDASMVGSPVQIATDLPKSGLLMMNSFFGQSRGDNWNRWVLLFQVVNYKDGTGKKSVQQMPRFAATIPNFSELTYVCEVPKGASLPTDLNGWIAKKKSTMRILDVAPTDMTSGHFVQNITDTGATVYASDNVDLWGTWSLSLKQGVEMQNFFVSKGSSLYLVSQFGWVMRFMYAAYVWPCNEYNCFSYIENTSPVVRFEGAIY